MFTGGASDQVDDIGLHVTGDRILGLEARLYRRGSFGEDLDVDMWSDLANKLCDLFLESLSRLASVQ